VTETLYARAGKFMVAEIGGDLVALGPDGQGCFGLDPIAGTVWRSLDQPKSFDQLRRALLAQYDVDAEQCSNELRQLLDDLVGEGLVEECAGPARSVPAEPPQTSQWSGPAASVSPEFSLLVRCCRQTFAGERSGGMDGPVDWDLFLRLARFHRVQGLVAGSLASEKDDAPAGVADALTEDAASIAAANLVAAAESRGLLLDFERAGVPLLFVKGLTLGSLVYGSASLKSAVDIDLLVAERDIPEAAAVLQRRGFKMVIPAGAPDPEQLRAWHHRRKESVWNRGAVHIDLHSRLADNPGLIPSVGIDSPRQQVEVSSGIRLPTLARDELFAYLTVHGASSAWFRLKWITDLAGLLHGLPPGEIERLYARSQELGAYRAAGQALLLADQLYGSLAGTKLRAELPRDPAHRRLADAALRQLAGKAEPREPTSGRLGTWRIHLTQFDLKPGLGFKLSELSRQIGAAIL